MRSPIQDISRPCTLELEALRGLLIEERYAPDDLVVQRGEAAARLFLITQGEVSVFVNLENGQRRRKATIRAGSSFGQAATIFGGTRTADCLCRQG